MPAGPNPRRAGADDARRRILCAVALAGLAACTGQQSLRGPIFIGSDQLQDAVAKRMPLERALAGLGVLRLDQPEVRLDPARNRVAVGFRATVLIGERPLAVLRGVLSGIPAWRSPDRTLLMAEPLLETLRSETSAPGGEALAALIRAAVAPLIADLPVYRLDPEALTLAGVEMEPASLQVTRDALVVTLRPRRPGPAAPGGGPP